MLSETEIIRQLNIIRYSPMAHRYGWHLPSISGVAREAGITRAAIYAMLKRGSVGLSQARLSHALQRCQAGWRERSPGRHPMTDAAQGRF